MGISTQWEQQSSNLDEFESEIHSPNMSDIEDTVANTNTRIHHLQAAHISGTNKTIYGNSFSF